MKMSVVFDNQCEQSKEKRHHNIVFHVISQVLCCVSDLSLVALEQDGAKIQKGSPMGPPKCQQQWLQQEQSGRGIEH